MDNRTQVKFRLSLMPLLSLLVNQVLKSKVYSFMANKTRLRKSNSSLPLWNLPTLAIRGSAHLYKVKYGLVFVHIFFYRASKKSVSILPGDILCN